MFEISNKTKNMQFAMKMKTTLKRFNFASIAVFSNHLQLIFERLFLSRFSTFILILFSMLSFSFCSSNHFFFRFSNQSFFRSSNSFFFRFLKFLFSKFFNIVYLFIFKFLIDMSKKIKVNSFHKAKLIRQRREYLEFRILKQLIN